MGDVIRFPDSARRCPAPPDAETRDSALIIILPTVHIERRDVVAKGLCLTTPACPKRVKVAQKLLLIGIFIVTLLIACKPNEALARSVPLTPKYAAAFDAAIIRIDDGSGKISFSFDRRLSIDPDTGRIWIHECKTNFGRQLIGQISGFASGNYYSSKVVMPGRIQGTQWSSFRHKLPENPTFYDCCVSIPNVENRGNYIHESIRSF